MKQLTSGALAGFRIAQMPSDRGKAATSAGKVYTLISLRLRRKTASRIVFAPKNCILREERQD